MNQVTGFAEFEQKRSKGFCVSGVRRALHSNLPIAGSQFLQIATGCDCKETSCGSKALSPLNNGKHDLV